MLVIAVIAIACTVGVTAGDKMVVMDQDENAVEARNLVKKGKKTKGTRMKDDSIDQQGDVLEATIVFLEGKIDSQQEVIDSQHNMIAFQEEELLDLRDQCTIDPDQEEPPSFLFVQIATNCELRLLDGGRITAVGNIGEETHVFSDRPQRLQYNMKTLDFVEYFDRTFKDSLPNAAITAVSTDRDQFGGPVVAILSNASMMTDGRVSYDIAQSDEQNAEFSLLPFFKKGSVVQFTDCSIFIDSVGPPGGHCEDWCESDRPGQGDRHCAPGNMAHMCGGCDYCGDTPTPSPVDPPPSHNNNNVDYCEAPYACNGDVWNREAATSTETGTCGSRIHYLRFDKPGTKLTKEEACEQIYNDFRNICTCSVDPPPPVVSSSTFAITNNSPEMFGCSTIYCDGGQKVKQSIKYFGNSCGSGGCDIAPGQTAQHTLNGVSSQIGIQWNLSRLGSDGATCDNPCRQLNVNLSTCTYSLVTSGFCYEPPHNKPWDARDTPRWTPVIDGSFVNGVCTFTVTEMSTVGLDSDQLCGCSDGHQPCNCGDQTSGMSTCQGVCPADVSITPGSCIGAACTCYINNNPVDPPPSHNNNNVDYCEAPYACNEDVWNREAGTSTETGTCGSRINWVQFDNSGPKLTKEAACEQIYNDFRNICTCPNNNNNQR